MCQLIDPELYRLVKLFLILVFSSDSAQVLRGAVIPVNNDLLIRLDLLYAVAPQLRRAEDLFKTGLHTLRGAERLCICLRHTVLISRLHPVWRAFSRDPEYATALTYVAALLARHGLVHDIEVYPEDSELLLSLYTVTVDSRVTCSLCGRELTLDSATAHLVSAHVKEVAVAILARDIAKALCSAKR